MFAYDSFVIVPLGGVLDPLDDLNSYELEAALYTHISAHVSVCF